MKEQKAAIDVALDRIYSYIDYSLTKAEDHSSAIFSLEKITTLLNHLGNPQERYQTVHVAGTKGKGSVCTMVYSCLLAAGYHVGLYTSPHLIRFNERIQVDGKMIHDDELIILTDEVISKMDPQKPASTFDLMTAIALTYFAQKKVDIAIIETGLGGRLDSTNVLKPILTGITSISLDHTQFLGKTIPEIAREKGGIIKPHVPLVTAQTHPEALAVLSEIADQRGAELIDVEKHWHSVCMKDSPRKQKLMVWHTDENENLKAYLQGEKSLSWKPWMFSTGLVGQHQEGNARIAFSLLMKLKTLGYRMTRKSIKEGFSSAFWPCRFEIINKKPIIILDGAHNPDSMEKLVETTNRFFGRKKITCVFGASEDKNVREMIKKLAIVAQDFIMTRSTHPRSVEPQQILEYALSYGRKADVCDTLEEALKKSLEKCPDQVILVTGSLFVAGGIRELLMAQNPEIEYYTE